MNPTERAKFTAVFLDRIALRLDAWADESRRGGWSTHQVTPNREMANECRREAAELRAAIFGAEART